MINKKIFFLKRIIDVVVSGIGLIILFPIFAVIGMLIKLDSKGPVFFVQERAGKDGRITRVGKHLRWGIDELPQLINVFRGEMSLVGPRPTLPEQVSRYSKEHRRRLEMKPGLTGWALVNGRNALSWSEKIKLDIWYIDHWSLCLDLKILIKTIWVVIFLREGIYGRDGVTRDYEREI